MERIQLSSVRLRTGRFLFLVSLAMAIFLCGDHGIAQNPKPLPDLTEMSLEDLMEIEVDSVYGASKYLQKVTQAPASISIVTAEDIQKYGYRTLADVLRSVRGFYISYDRNYSYVGVRGFARPGDFNSRILVLVDGHRVNDNIFDQASLGTDFPVDVDLIDRVEVIRGPNSSLYLASAFLGVVNVITKQGRNEKSLRASAELASYGTFKSRLTYGNRFANGLEMFLSGSFYDSRGEGRLYFKEYDSPATNYGIAQNADYDQSHQLFAELAYHDFTLHAVYGSREKGIPTASYDTVFNDSRNRTVDARGFVDLQYEHQRESGWGVLGRLSYDQYDYHGTYVYDSSVTDVPSRVLNQDNAYGKWWGGELNVLRTFHKKHHLVLGSKFRDDFQQDQGNFDVNPFTSYFNDHRNSQIWAAYLQGDVVLRHDLVLNLGLRHDHYSTFGGTTNPRAALIYSPRKPTTLKFLYAQAFRAPNAFELYYQGTGGESNPYLRPETVKTGEVVVEQYLGKRYLATASAFGYWIQGLISQQTDPVSGLLGYKNIGRATGKGLEFELRRKSSWGLEAGVSYSFLDVKDVPSGEPLTNSPRHLGKLNFSAPLVRNKVFASLNLEYMSKRRTLSGAYAGGHMVPSLTLFSRGVLRGWEISASVYNFSNTKYGDPGAEEHRQDVIDQDGRTFRLKVAYRF